MTEKDAGPDNITQLARSVRLPYHPLSFPWGRGIGCPGSEGKNLARFSRISRLEGGLDRFSLAKSLKFLQNGAKPGKVWPGPGTEAHPFLIEKAGDTIFVEDHVVLEGLAHRNGTGLALTSSYVKKRCGSLMKTKITLV
jgi:hypothetical protein